MRRLALALLAVLFLVPLSAPAVTTQIRTPVVLGFLPASSAPSVATLQVNAAATWLAFAFVPPESKTISKVKLYASAIAGAPSFTVDIYSDSAAGVPNASLSTSATLSPGASGWLEFTGLSQAVTGGTRYWIVAKNTSANPATDNLTFRWGSTDTGMVSVSGTSNIITWGWDQVSSTDSGTTWATGKQANVTGYRLEYSDGSFDGFPVDNISNSAAIGGNKVYATREYGVYFTSPANVVLKVRCLSMYAYIGFGTPSARARFRLYTGATPTLVATTNLIPVGNMTSAAWRSACFSATQTIQPSTVVRVTLGEDTNADGSSVYYTAYVYEIENDANSKALMPFAGTLQETYYDGTTWTQTATRLPPFGMILDTDAPFGSTGTGGNGVIGG